MKPPLSYHEIDYKNTPKKVKTSPPDLGRFGGCVTKVGVALKMFVRCYFSSHPPPSES